MPTVQSIEFGKGAYTTDYSQRAYGASTSILYCGWAKPNDVNLTSYPKSRGNNPIFAALGTNWSTLLVVDNMDIQSDGFASRYNCNTMVFGNAILDGGGWINDYAMYIDYGAEAFTEAESLAWKFFACQITLNGDSSITMRIWMKIGSRSMLKLAEETATLAGMRANLVSNAGWSSAAANAWTPSGMPNFRFGTDMDGADNNGFEVFQRVYNTATEPSLSSLEAIAANFDADTGAWGDYAYNWTGGAPVLTDRSGNGRNLTNMGTLYQGPDFTYTAGTTDYSLTATGVTTSVPSLGSPAVAQAHALAAVGLTTGTPNLATPTLNQNRVLTATGLTTTAPVLSAVGLSQIHALAGSGLATSAPVLGSPAVGQNHAIAANALAAGSPTLGTPVFLIDGVIAPVSISTGAPVLGAPALGQVHALAGAGIAVGAPILGTPAINGAVVDYELMAAGFDLGEPVLGEPSLDETVATASIIAIITASARSVTYSSTGKIASVTLGVS